MNKRNVFLTRAAAIAAVYAVLTLIGAVFGLSYNSIQFRFSEAMCILPLFSSAAVPGLTVGCVVANIMSSVNPLDTVIGSLATLIAAVLTRKCRNATIKGYPLLSMCFPVIMNALLVGAEIAFFTDRNNFLPAFGINALSVGIGEAAVIFTLGSALYSFIRKNNRIGKLLSD